MRSGINPKTGRRFNWTDPVKAKQEEARLERKAARDVEQELALLLRVQRARECREDLLKFTQFTMPDPEDPNNIDKSTYVAAMFHRAVAKHLEEVERGDIRQLIFCMPPRHGKQIADSEDVLTTEGWKKHGELRPGDRVFAPDGKPIRVVAVSDPSNEKMDVHFTDGTVVRCHPNHEWTVFDRSSGGVKTLETRRIAARATQGRATLQLPCVNHVCFDDRQLPLDPYTLGVWLGDGSVGAGRINMAASDSAVWDKIEASGLHATAKWVHKTTGVVTVNFGGGTLGALGPLTSRLAEVGVLRRKHIPEIYLRSGLQQRLELLAGLMDTDGHVEAGTSRCRIVSVFPELVAGVFDLCTTLGFRPYVTSQEPVVSGSGVHGRRTVFTVGFQPTMALPTVLARKQVHRFAAQRRIGISKVTEAPDEPGRCIQVDSADGLYLVSRHLLPTHNSALATKSFAAWYSGKHPEHDIAVASYSDTMANDFGADTRFIMLGKPFGQIFPNHKLRRGGSAKDNIQTTRGGRLVYVGRGGALTGRGANLLLIDDLFKDFEEARSQAIRDQAWNWFTKVAMTRRMSAKLVVITMTRWHSDDIIGRLTDPENPYYNADEAEKWKIIRFPAVAEEDDPLHRPIGEALWPERYDLEFMRSQQRLDPLGFASLYQQRPTVADGVLFRRETIQYYDKLPDNMRYYAASDHAVGEKQRNDPSCLLKVGVDQQDNIYIVDTDWRRMPSDVATEAMLAMGGGSRKPLLWWAERGHISKSIGPFLRKRMLETGTYINLVEVTPASDKTQRAQSIAARVAMGKVFFPRVSAWTERAVNELLSFPNGTHDDFVDALAYIGLGLESQFGRKHAIKAGTEPAYGTLEFLRANDKAVEARKRAASRGGF